MDHTDDIMAIYPVPLSHEPNIPFKAKFVLRPGTVYVTVHDNLGKEERQTRKAFLAGPFHLEELG